MAHRAMAAKAVPVGRRPQGPAARKSGVGHAVGRVQDRPAHSVSPYLLDDITLTRDELLAARGYRQPGRSEGRAA